jgi:hypothetical protein
MTDSDKRDHEAALQYLTWALEEIERFGRHPEAAFHVRAALDICPTSNVQQRRQNAESRDRRRVCRYENSTQLKMDR